VELQVVQLAQLAAQGADLPVHHLGVDRQLEEPEVELALLVARRAAREVHREGDVGNLEREVGDGDAGRQLQLGEADERAAVDQPQLGAGRRSFVFFRFLGHELRARNAAT